jgi:hypothetical protein
MTKNILLKNLLLDSRATQPTILFILPIQPEEVEIISNILKKKNI